MKNLSVNGPFTHDLMMTVLVDLYPGLAAGLDYNAAHPLSADTNEQDGEPFLLFWKSKDVPQPDAADIKAKFLADEVKYRAAFARRVRDAFLEWSDVKAVRPDDAPPTVRMNAQAWKAYRQALRDLPGQAGFPLDIDWPDMPAGN